MIYTLSYIQKGKIASWTFKDNIYKPTFEYAIVCTTITG